MYTPLAKFFIGRRVTIAEVECAAAGAPRCKFAYYK
jgi:predicted hydrocarbon binding protein